MTDKTISTERAITLVLEANKLPTSFSFRKCFKVGYRAASSGLPPTLEWARIKELEGAFLKTCEARYEIDRKWREAWTALSNKKEPGRLQSRQDKIESRALIADRRIAGLIRIQQSIVAGY